MRNSVWGEPFFNVPKELGPYAYSTLNVRLDTIQKDPELVRGFVRGMVKGLEVPLRQPDEAARDRQEAISDHAARRSQGDARPLVRGRDVEQGRHDQPDARPGHRPERVVREAGILKSDVPYDEIIDMSFVEAVRATL